jgi:cysteine desulfurase/selenocysteine lyase
MYKKQFKIFDTLGNIYLDSASTTQKPSIVLDAMNDFYTSYCSNTHRGNCKLGNKATIEYEKARDKVKILKMHHKEKQ